MFSFNNYSCLHDRYTSIRKLSRFYILTQRILVNINNFKQYILMNSVFTFYKLELTVCKDPPSLVTVAIPENIAALTLHTCSHAVKNTSWSKEETDHVQTDKTEQVTSGTKQRSQDSQLSYFVIFKEIQIINTVLWLFNMWQITVLPQFKHVNRSSLHLLT